MASLCRGTSILERWLDTHEQGEGPAAGGIGHASAMPALGHQWDAGKHLVRLRRKTKSPTPHDTQRTGSTGNADKARPPNASSLITSGPPPPPSASHSTHHLVTTMSAASAGQAPLDLMQILITIIFPIVGGLLGLALSLCPMLAMPTIERTKSLGGFTPRPSCVFLCTSMLWCIYGVVIGNAFVFCANVPLVFVSLHIILRIPAHTDVPTQRAMERILHLSTFLLLSLGATFLFHPSLGPSLTSSFALLANLVLYASPLSSLPVVLRTRTAATSIHLPWCLCAIGCSLMWGVYGVATGQLPLVVAHAFGLIVNFVLVGVRICLAGEGRREGGVAEDKKEGKEVVEEVVENGGVGKWVEWAKQQKSEEENEEGQESQDLSKIKATQGRRPVYLPPILVPSPSSYMQAYAAQKLQGLPDYVPQTSSSLTASLSTRSSREDEDEEEEGRESMGQEEEDGEGGYGYYDHVSDECSIYSV